MVVNGLDMNYLGVSNVWSNDLGSFFVSVRVNASS